MIKSIWIEHFKSLSHVSLSLEDVSVIVGGNSTGKSNFIDAIAFLRDCVVHGLDHAVSERHGIDSIVQWSPTRPYNLDISARYATDYGEGHYSLKLSSKSRQPIIIEEYGAWKSPQQEIMSSFTRTKNEVYFSGLQGKNPDELKRYTRRVQEDELTISSLKIVPISSAQPFRHLNRAISDFRIYNIYPNTIRSPQKSSNEHELTSAGDNLNSVLKQMVSSKSIPTKVKYQEILGSMAKIIPNLDRVLVRYVSGLLWPIFEVRESAGRGHQFNVSQISDGALRFLGILTALYQPYPPRVIAIEEPEQNIHPGALSLLAEAFKDISKEIQIITTTHSPHMLDFFDVKNIYATEYTDGKTIIGHISKQQKEAISARLLTAGEVMTAQGFEVEPKVS